MKASVANFGDVNQMAKVCQRLHAASSWQELEFNPTHVRKNLMKIVREPGMDALVVKDNDGKIVGVLLATVDEFFISKERYATDIHFMCDAGGIQLLAEFKRWAMGYNASKIVMGIANDDPDGRVHKFYEAMGMRPVGDAWVMDLSDSQEKAA